MIGPGSERDAESAADHLRPGSPSTHLGVFVRIVTASFAVLALVGALSVGAAPGLAYTSSGPWAPRSGTLFGAFPNGPGGVTALQSEIGRTLALQNRYVPWTFSSWSSLKPDTAGRILMVSWSAAPTTTAAAILKGRQDAVIRRAAIGLRGTGGRILLRPFYEFDQPTGHPRHIGTPNQVIRAWRRLVNLFRAEHATNVHFAWSPMAFDFPSGFAQKFWPGGAYVGWVAPDGYNFPGKTWKSFGEIFAAGYTFGVRKDKPVLAGETASPATDSRTPGWMLGARQWIKAHRDFKAICYFDSVSPKGNDFRVTSSAATMAAFKQWGQQAWFRAR